MTALLVGAGGFVGLLIGSFVNVLAHRVPVGISVVRPPSACPACGHEIRARHNLPVAGWLILRGRCHDCGVPIPVRYPLVEVACGTLFALTPLVVGIRWVLPAFWWLVGVTLALVLTDLDHQRIPNRILYPGAVVAVALLAGGAALDDDLTALWRGLAGGAVYFGSMLVVALVARGGFGFGDVKLAFLLGVFLAHTSWEALGAGVFLAFILGGLVSIVLLAARRVGRKAAIPFGPPMIIGTYLALAFGDDMARWYLGW